MLEICWYCDSPIDVDESIEGHTEMHKECLLELATGGGWDSFIARAEHQKMQHLQAVEAMNTNIRIREAAILAAN